MASPDCSRRRLFVCFFLKLEDFALQRKHLHCGIVDRHVLLVVLYNELAGVLVGLLWERHVCVARTAPVVGGRSVGMRERALLSRGFLARDILVLGGAWRRRRPGVRR